MCFISKPTPVTYVEKKQNAPVERQKASASLTKTSETNSTQGTKENIKTTPQGVLEPVNNERKTLLGE